MNFRLVFCLMIFAGTVACTRPPKPVQVADPAKRLEAIPAADKTKYLIPGDTKSWRNPYLVVHADGIGIWDPSNHEEHRLSLEQLPDALASLPPSAWPYGRVVALQEAGGAGSFAELPRIRDNRAKVAATLHSLQILINYVPSA